jgi:hypothetical protein
MYRGVDYFNFLTIKSDKDFQNWMKYEEDK